MNTQRIKNIEFGKAIALADILEYKPGQVISITLAQNEAISITLFALPMGEEISTHITSGDAFVYILDGTADITIGGETQSVKEGETIVMPSDVPHSLNAQHNFKMLLVVVK